MKVAGLFAGIGGIELGFHRHGFETGMLCEIDPHAIAVLEERFPGVPIQRDIRELAKLPKGIEVLTAGFPCQDLSQAGNTKGISGDRSGLVSHVFRLIERSRTPWVVVENVSFMLRLDRGSAMRVLADSFEQLGYRWAYRVLDSRAFGLPQRRERVYFVASLTDDPATLLFSEDAGPREPKNHEGKACGFYWTEGLRGLGWGIDCVPTLKGGSTVGIPSPPAIWMTDGGIVTPDIRDAERMQGFDADWTQPAESVGRPGHRWKLVGNAVTVDAAAWVAERIADKSESIAHVATKLPKSAPWPDAAFGGPGGRFSVSVSRFPVARERPDLEAFLTYPARPLSARATRGFLSRLERSSLRYPPEFASALDYHLMRLESYVGAQPRLPGIGVRDAA